MKAKKNLSQQELNQKKQYRLNEAEKLGIVGQLESGIPIREIARQTGRSLQTIWKLKENARAPLPQVESIKKRLSGKMWERADKAEDLLGGKLEEMNPRDLVGAIHYAILDARLMDDQSTVNVAQAIGIDPALRGPLLAISSRLSGKIKAVNRDKDGGGEASGQD